jgi:hypothetical protein
MAKKKKNNEILHLKVNQLMLTTGRVITFNDEQYVGVNKIRVWLKKEGQIFFTLAGFAGTGKSTVIKKIIDEYRGSIVVSAPTHKAKKVIMNTTGMDAQTLHSLLGLRPDVDLDSFNPNDPQFGPIAEPKIGNFDFVIIDEASMINLELFNMIVEKTKDTSTKVLFMGDPAQIPPVGEKESVIFYQPSIEIHWLTKIERQNEGNPITTVYDALRNNLTDPYGGFIRKSETNELGEGIIFTTDKDEFRKAILVKYRSDEFQANTDYAKVIAWRNKTVMGANKVIRNELFGDHTDIVEVGDILMGYRSVRSSNSQYNIIENSGDYRVVSKSELQENKYHLMGYAVRLREDLAHGKFKFKDVFIINTNDQNNLNKYGLLHDFYRDIGKSSKDVGSWTQYYNFRRQNILMKTIKKHENGVLRSKKDIIVKDMDYGMAITAHKAQGSTYTHVFVMENDINMNWLTKEKNQLKYTAFTRPTISATVLTDIVDYEN